MSIYSTNPTLIGQVASVSSSVVQVKLHSNLPSASIIVNGVSYRIGQIGSFLRIPLGYTSLYAVCTQVGAVATPSTEDRQLIDTTLEKETDEQLSGYRQMTIALFGEGVGNTFERGVGQFPTIGDEVHIATNDDLSIIYGWAKGEKGTISVGTIATATGISADINIAKLVSRHCTIVGSTGAGKSNLVAVLLESVSSGEFPNSRTIVIDPHGEYATALKDKAQVFRINPDKTKCEKPLWVPFWTLPISELTNILFDDLSSDMEEIAREEIFKLKRKNIAEKIKNSLLQENFTADTPIPFGIKEFWYDLDRFEKSTFRKSQDQTKDTECRIEEGNPENLISARFIPASPYNQEPYLNQSRRHIKKQLEFMKSRLQDSRYSFLFNPGSDFTPNIKGETKKDIDALVSEWVGHEKPISIFDVSGLPSEILPTIVGTMLRVIYDMLFWAQGLPISGREQPLLIVIEEAHLFFTKEGNTPAHRTLSMIAKEGRKYGVGLTLVSQRPSEIGSTVLSQSGSFIAMRLTNEIDQSTVKASVSDDLGGLVGLLPSLRTGEGLFLGEIMPIPSRVRVREAKEKPIGDDPELPKAWQKEPRPDPNYYAQALSNWRQQSFLNDSHAPSSTQKENSHEPRNT